MSTFLVASRLTIALSRTTPAAPGQAAQAAHAHAEAEVAVGLAPGQAAQAAHAHAQAGVAVGRAREMAQPIQAARRRILTDGARTEWSVSIPERIWRAQPQLTQDLLMSLHFKGN